tara:strand:+ start:1136 stop:1936 length:801 start_codon:yes stop_codon:yes gene_type:complete
MRQLLNFFLKFRTSILFLILFNISLALTVNVHDYHKSKLLNLTSAVTGSIHEFFSDISNYFNLKNENRVLLLENNRLKELEFNIKKTEYKLSKGNEKYKLTTATLIKNSYSLTKNYLIINKGSDNLINEDLGVITSNGIVGVIDKVSNKYSRIISVLNTMSKINAKLKKSNHFGTLEWNGNNSNIVQLHDIQALVELTIGDTIVTSGYSSIFPKNIPIGSIKSFKLNDTKDLFEIDIKLFNDMTNLEHVHIIENINIKEIENLNNE